MVDRFDHRPSVSIVVVVYNMPREAPRTLLSLSATYQLYIEADDYEIIVVDNGSNPRFDPKEIEKLSGNFRLIRIDPAPPSPAHAVNRGLAEARGQIIGVMIDGAHLVTPGLLHFARHGVGLYDNAIVTPLGWYLGYDLQAASILSGYNQSREDALLAEINWPQDGYRLFEISAMNESTADGWFQPIAESNALFLRRELWESLGGFDEQFDAPGGGLVNFDTLCRALGMPDARLVVLLGEGTFHQVHGGIATNAHPDQFSVRFSAWASQFQKLRGRPNDVPRSKHPPTYLGTLPRPTLARMVRAAVHPIFRYSESPLGAEFNQEVFANPAGKPHDETIAALVEVAQREFRNGHDEAACAVARLIRARAPDEANTQHLLAQVSPWLHPQENPRPEKRADFHLALGEAHHLLGEDQAADENYRTALTFNPDLREAHLGLARLRMPGDDYFVWLEKMYRTLAPEIVIEIGVFQGASLALIQPPTVAIGVDPEAVITSPLKTETHIFAETSNEFFAARRLDKLLAGRPLSIAFIDGLHLFEQALRDFINLEGYCDARSIILLHDTIPLDEATQTRIRHTQCHTGDVWKTVLCLKQYRPDLDIFTIPTWPTGLTVVSRLDPVSRVLADRYEEAVSQFIDAPFSTIEGAEQKQLNLVPNDWDFVWSRLQARSVARIPGELAQSVVKDARPV